MLAAITLGGGAWQGVLVVLAMDGVFVVWIILAAGGLGWATVGWLLPRDVRTALRTFTEIGAGLMLLGLLVMLAGWLVPGGLDAWRWMLLLGAAGLLGAWPIARWLTRSPDGHSRPLSETLDDLHVPGRAKRSALWWIIPAVAGAIWLSGASVPAGLIGNADDIRSVLQVHLQLPREYLHNESTLPVAHNVHSHRPCSVEMLSLLAMIIRGGGWEGMYTAKLLHGVFGLLAAGAMWTTLPRSTPRSRYAVALLVSSPVILYLSWLAEIELATVLAAALGVAWLRLFSKRPSAGSAVAIGLAGGIAVSTSYLAATTFALPLLAAMLVIALWPTGRRASAHSDELHAGAEELPSRPGLAARLMCLVLATGVVALAAAPWLARTHAATGNPVFPQATETFGTGPWNNQQLQRWQHAHQPTDLPPVPPPPGDHEHQPRPDKAARFEHRLLSTDGLNGLGTALVLLAAGGAVIALVSSRRQTPWNVALVVMAVAQVAGWVMFTRNLPATALAAALVPLAWLAALAADHVRGRLQRVLGGKISPETPERDVRMVARVASALPAVAVILGAAMAMATALETYAVETHGLRVHGMEAQAVANVAAPWSLSHQLVSRDRIMLVGQDDPYYFPPGTIYATPWDVHPLERLARKHPDSPRAILRGLRNLEVSHVWVNWTDIERFSRRMGYPSALQADQGERLAAGKPVGLEVLDKLMAEGVRPIGQVGPDHVLRPGAAIGPPPTISIYTLPPIRAE